MPDLSHKASLEYWYSYQDPMIYRVITFMESVEEWTLDGDANLEAAIFHLGEVLENIEKVDLNTIAQEANFIKIIGNIKSGRGLRLLQAIDTVHPGSASKVLMHAEEITSGPTDPAGFFLRRNITFERLRLIARVFSGARLKLIAQAFEGEE